MAFTRCSATSIRPGEALAGILREGRAGANTAADHGEVLGLALEQLPEAQLERPMLARSDSAGATHEFAHALSETGIRFSLGFQITAAVPSAILAVAEGAWAPAIAQDGAEREGAQVCELTAAVALCQWPTGTRLICSRERPHPGAQLSFTDHDGHRFQCLITDQEGAHLAALEAHHRSHARVEYRIRCAKALAVGPGAAACLRALAGTARARLSAQHRPTTETSRPRASACPETRVEQRCRPRTFARGGPGGPRGRPSALHAARGSPRSLRAGY